MFDIRAGDRMSWFTTTGWMMWNFLRRVDARRRRRRCCTTAAPATRTSTSCGSWRRRRGCSLFGTSAAFLAACMKAGIRPGDGRDLSRAAGDRRRPARRSRSRRSAGSTTRSSRTSGSSSMSGGTDVVQRVRRRLPAAAGPRRRAPGARRWARGSRRSTRPAGPSSGETGELVLTAPLPSMPVFFWNDPDGARYRESYFEMYPGVWRHGDWIRITERGSAVIEGRSDSTLNRQGIRFGTSELYGVVERLPEVARQPRHRAGAARTAATGCRCSSSSPTASTLDDASWRGSTARSARRCRSATSRTTIVAVPADPADADRQEDGGPGQAAAPGPPARRGRGAGRDRRPARARLLRRLRPGRRAMAAAEAPRVSCRRWTHRPAARSSSSSRSTAPARRARAASGPRRRSRSAIASATRACSTAR